MQSSSIQNRSLRLCGSSIDARLDEPVPLRIRKSHEGEDPIVNNGSNSRRTSAGSVSHLFTNARPLTIMKRRGRPGRPPLRNFVDTPADPHDVLRELSSCQHLPNSLDGPAWHYRPGTEAQVTHTQSLAVRKTRERQPSLVALLKDTFQRDRGPSEPLFGRRWRSDSPWSLDEDVTHPGTEGVGPDLRQMPMDLQTPTHKPRA
ncbi:hypothetical protein LIA77_07297 [Sarocladium implicatum]|nr:hypothetical protein LIA77_07297 [Sarocladium implicatum]